LLDNAKHALRYANKAVSCSAAHMIGPR
jgi:hypothetical protein